MINRDVVILDQRFKGVKGKIVDDCKLMDMWLVNLYQEDNKTSDQYNVLYIPKGKVETIKTEQELRDEKRIKEYENLIMYHESSIREIKKDIEKIRNNKTRIVILE